MLNSLSHFEGSTVTATDGQLGHVHAVFFDDRTWTIRYVVVDTGAWLTGREVLISPYAVLQPLGPEKNVNVRLSRQQVKDSPDVDTHKPVSRQHELDYMRYYDFPMYWGGSGMWGDAMFPMAPPYLPAEPESAAAREHAGHAGHAENADATDDADVQDRHLRSSREVTGYNIQATDDSIGHVSGLIFDDESWAVRYLVVDTRNWLPGGKKVLVANHWIDRIDWSTESVHVTLTRDQVEHCPDYAEGLPLTREYEQRLHEVYGRTGYWD